MLLFEIADTGILTGDAAVGSNEIDIWLAWRAKIMRIAQGTVNHCFLLTGKTPQG
jgi:hypothetical protein